MRWRNLVIAVLFCTSAAGWWTARRELAKPKDDGFSLRRLAFLEKENRRLAEQLAQQFSAQETAADAVQRSEIERKVTNLRELPYLRPVSYRQIPRSELPMILRKKLLQQVPDREFADSGLALAALGLLPPGIDLKKTYLALLGEQIGAFYDQHTQELFTFSGQPLSNSQNRVILAHELTHALEDQHFHLANLPLEAKGNDDRALAASALVEGDATLVMNRYLLNNLSGAVLKDTLAGSFSTDVRQLAAAPRYLRETLLFPYLKGLVFCQELYDRGGWAALAEAFRHPPSCTAQILHPERYLADPRQEPVKIEYRSTAIGGQDALVDNVLGEFGVRQLMRTWMSEENAVEIGAGWAGDRYLVFADAKGSSYIWRSVWTSSATAQRFAAGARVHWEKRGVASPKEATNPDPASASEEDPGGWSSCLQDGRELRIYRDDRVVTLIDAQNSSLLKSLEALRSN